MNEETSFKSLLHEFESIDHKAKNANERYAALKEKVKTVYPLTYSQRSAIDARCNNAINGTYNFGDMGYKPSSYDKNRSENKK